MPEKLTWDEIKKQYPDEWVVLVDVDWPNMGEITAGIVRAHSAHHTDALEQVARLRSAAILWTGRKHGVALLAAVDVDRAL